MLHLYAPQFEPGYSRHLFCTVLASLLHDFTFLFRSLLFACSVVHSFSLVRSLSIYSLALSRLLPFALPLALFSFSNCGHSACCCTKSETKSCCCCSQNVDVFLVDRCIPYRNVYMFWVCRLDVVRHSNSWPVSTCLCNVSKAHY